MKETGLLFQEVSVNIVFSLFLDTNSCIKKYYELIAKVNNTKDNIKIDVSFENILKNQYSKYGLESDNEDNWKFKKGKPNERIGVTPNLRVYSHEFYKKFDFGIVDIGIIKTDGNSKLFESLLREKQKYSLEGLLRIFDSGVGTFTLKFTIKNSDYKDNGLIATKDIYHIYDLLNSGDDRKYNYPLIKFAEKKYPFFVTHPKNENNDSIGNKFNTHRLVDIYQDLLHSLNLNKKLSNLDIGIKNSPKKGIIDNNNPKLDCQNPYIIIIGKKPFKQLNSKNGNSLSYLKYPLNWWDYTSGEDVANFESEDQIKIKRKFRETTLLLYRYIKGSTILNLDPDQFDKTIPLPFNNLSIKKFFNNHSWFENSFIAAHPRATLFFFENTESESLKEIPCFIQKSLLDLFELVRSRWHFSVVINELLDIEIENLRSLKVARNQEFIFSILEKRKLFASYLSDPLTYSFGGGLVFDLQDNAKDFFQLDYLKEMIESKFDVLDQLINDFMLAKLI